MTWTKRYMCTQSRDIVVCSRMAADTTIQNWQRLHGRLYSAWESHFVDCTNLHRFGIELFRTSWTWLNSWHHKPMEDCSCTMLRLKASSFLQSFYTSMICSYLLLRLWLEWSTIRWRSCFRCMILEVSPSILAWKLNTVRRVTRLRSNWIATLGHSWRRSSSISTGQLPPQLW